ncbi:MAG: tetratricopeptide repeat protein [Bacteroidota bacterium]|nr:tetratricopeptide repeat protein [Bacteroidota bacterium]
MLNKTKILFILIITISVKIYGQKNNDLFLKANADIINKDYENAIVNLSYLINKDNKAKYLIKRSEIYLIQKEYTNAIKDCIKANKIKQYSANYQLAIIAVKQNNYLQAINYLNKYLLYTKHVQLSELLNDSSFYKIHYTQEWEKLLQQKWSKNYISSIKNIISFLNKEKYISALNITNQLITNNNAELYYLKTNIYTKQNNYVLALEAISKALKKHFNKDYLLLRAQIYSKLGNTKLAIKDYNKLIYISPENLNLYIYRTKEYLKINRNTKAKNDINFVLKYLPNNCEINFIKAQISFNNKNYISTLKTLNILIKTNKGNEDFYILRGDTYMQTKMYKYAAKDYSMALDLTPRNGNTYYKLAKAQIKNNNKHKACFNIKRAIRYGNKKAVLLKNKYCSEN